MKLFCFTCTRQSVVLLEGGRQRLKAAVCPFPHQVIMVKIEIGWLAGCAGAGSPDTHQLLWVLERQRSQKPRVDQTEHGHGGADSQRERNQQCDARGRRTAQLPHTELKVLNHERQPVAQVISRHCCVLNRKILSAVTLPE